MRRSLYFLLVIIFAACNNNNTETNNKNAENNQPTIIRNDTIPTTRREVNPKPVATFFKHIPNSLNDWHFSVNVYETEKTFHYLMRMEYMEMREKDTLKIPNLGIWPKVEIRPASDEYSCIIGFYDKENNFKEYKQVTAKDGSLKVKVLHHYGVATYQSAK